VLKQFQMAQQMQNKLTIAIQEKQFRQARNNMFRMVGLLNSTGTLK
jgi:hypothetical protein